MAINDSIQPPSSSEIAITLFCWWEATASAPSIVNTLGRPFVSDELRATLLKNCPYLDSWIMWAFFVVTGFAMLTLLLSHRRRLSPNEIVIVERRDERLWWTGLFRFMRSMGLVVLQNFVLNQLGVLFYGTFARQENWPLEPNKKPYIDRLILSNGKTVEYQYLADYSNLSVREAAHGGTFSDAVERAPNFADFELLALASSYFPIWLCFHLVRRLALLVRNFRR